MILLQRLKLSIGKAKRVVLTKRSISKMTEEWQWQMDGCNHLKRSLRERDLVALMNVKKYYVLLIKKIDGVTLTPTKLYQSKLVGGMLK